MHDDATVGIARNSKTEIGNDFRWYFELEHSETAFWRARRKWEHEVHVCCGSGGRRQLADVF